MFKKLLINVFIALMVVIFGAVNVADAQFTILPTSKGLSDEQCISGLLILEAAPNLHQYMAERSAEERSQILGCAIQTGRISFSMIPFFITYIINFLLAIAGLITVLFIVIGGYNYIYGGLTENKEKGKKTIMHAVMGLSIAILAWVIIRVIIAAVTS